MKRTKSLSEEKAGLEKFSFGYKMTELGLLPEEWRVVSLGEVVKYTKEIIHPNRVPKARYVGLEHLEPGEIRIQRFGKASDTRSTKAVFRQGDILYGKLRPYLDKAALAEWDGVCSTDILVLRPTPKQDTVFLALLMHTSFVLHHAIATTTGVNHPRTSWKALSQALIPLPPLAEQRAIAHVLRTVQEAKEATEGVITALRDLKKSLMHHLFTYGPVPLHEADQVELQETPIGPIPAHWHIVRLGEVAKTTSGGTPKRDNPHFYGGDIPWLKSGELEDNDVYGAREFITEEGLLSSSAKIFGSGTLLIAMYDATAGKVGILKIPAATNQAICAIMPKEPLSFIERFIFYAFINFRKTLLARRHGGAQLNLSQAVIRNLLIPLPPLAEQEEIARILQMVDRKIEVEEARRQALEDLFKTLLHDLMTAKRRLPADFIAQFAEEKS